MRRVFLGEGKVETEYIEVVMETGGIPHTSCAPVLVVDEMYVINEGGFIILN